MSERPPRSRLRDRLFFSLAALQVLIRQRRPAELVSKAYRLWKRAGIAGAWRRIWWIVYATLGYARWVKQFDTLNDTDRRAILDHVDRFRRRPRISVLMPTYNTPEKWLRQAIDSIRAQLYTNWELCIADDASTQPQVRTILEKYQRLDPRIKVVFRETNGHISAASNSALQIASGDFVALLDHDDELPEHALYMVVAALNDKPGLDLIYSDEDKIDGHGRRFGPYFKPDWNPTLLTGQNFVSHLGVYRTALVRSIGGFRKGYEGSQDWDLALRVSEIIPASHVYHIPHVLYHWRAVAGSTATTIEEKPYALQAAEASLRDHLERTRQSGILSPVARVHFRIQYQIPSPPPLVSIILTAHNGLPPLRRCIEGLRKKTRYSRYEILIADSQSDDLETLNYLRQTGDEGIAHILRFDLPFNYSEINNSAVKAAQGSFLCLMNKNIEVISEDWLDEMVGQAAQPEIGAVGAMIYRPDNTIMHAGLLLDIEKIVTNPYSGFPRGTTGYMGRACLAQNISALSASCLVVRKAIYEEVGGLDETNLPVSFNDVDFCLRLLERGYRNLWTPFAELYQHASATRVQKDTSEKQKRFQKECAYMRTRWGRLLDNDPAYNPNLALDSSWPDLALPRIEKPWRH